jgi:hypothetical protein
MSARGCPLWDESKALELTSKISSLFAPVLTNHIIQECWLRELKGVDSLYIFTHARLTRYWHGWEWREHEGRVNVMLVARPSSVRPKKPRVTAIINIRGVVRIASARFDAIHMSASMVVWMPPLLPIIVSPFDVPAIASVTVGIPMASVFATLTTAMAMAMAMATVI